MKDKSSHPLPQSAATSTRRPKLCHLIHDGSAYGGGATISLAYFPAYGAQFDVFAITGRDGELAGQLRARGVRTLTLPMRRPLRAFFSLPALVQILRREKPEIVVVHGQWGGFFGAIAARLAGVRCVVYVTHFPSFYTDWTIVKCLRNHFAEKITCRFSQRVICLSRAGRYQYLLRRLAPATKLVCIPNGAAPLDLDDAPDRAALLTELQLPPETTGPLAVSISRLTDQKRIDWLLRAWATVERGSPDSRLVIVGDGPEEAPLRSLARELGLTRCHWLGAQPRGYRYFRAADFGIICSLFEGHPLALVEAMFVGCPMIGTAVDGIAETIRSGETGLLVPARRPARACGGDSQFHPKSCPRPRNGPSRDRPRAKPIPPRRSYRPPTRSRARSDVGAEHEVQNSPLVLSRLARPCRSRMRAAFIPRSGPSRFLTHFTFH